MENSVEDIGIVEQIIDTHTALVSIVKRGECSMCPGQKHCNTFKQESNDKIEARYHNELHKGDKVVLKFKPEMRITAALIIFLAPIIILIAFYYLTNLLFNNELLSIIVSIGSLIFFFIIIFLLSKKLTLFSNFKPTIVKIITNEEA